MPRGGKRPGAGLPKGYKFPKTIEREERRSHLRQRVLRELDPLLDAQIAHAKGIDHFFLRDEKTKQFKRIEDPVMIETALNAGDRDRYYWIFTKDPSIQAFTDLMNRTFDKPPEHVNVSGPEGGPLVFRHELA